MIKEWQPSAEVPADGQEEQVMIDDEQRCPLCARSNSCAAADEEQDVRDCWCMDLEEKVPQALLDRVPPEYQGECCICADCIRRYRLASKP